MAAVAAAVGVAIAAGCGSSSTTTPAGASTRAAAGDMPRMCAENRGIDVPARVTNNLAIPVQLWFTDINCAPWSGRTPAYYSGAILRPGATLEMPIRVASSGGPSWRTTLRSEDGRTDLASFRQVLVYAKRIGIVVGTSYAPTNAVSIAGAGKPATARMERRRDLVLGYAK